MSHTRLVLFLCAAILVFGCGGEEKSVETEGGKLTFKTEGKGVHISGEQEGVGEISGHFGENAEIPAGFPKDVPIYPGAKVLGSMLTGEGGMVTLQTGDDPGKAISFYREHLVKEGWDVASEMDLGEQHMLAVEKEGRNGAIQISREGSDTNILITISMGS